MIAGHDRGATRAETDAEASGGSHELDALRSRIVSLEHELAQRTAQLDVARRELDGFSYAVAHDLRTPIRALDGFSARLQALQGADLPPEGRRYLDRIRRNAQQLGQLVDGLLACSRLTRQPLRERDLSPRAVVDTVLDALAPERAGRNVEFRIGDLLPCRADARMIEQLYAVLLSNALKFTREREVAMIELGSLRDEDDVHRYWVKDNGAGFAMQHADKLFGLFQRLHHPGEFEGTGVGLAFCQRIVHRHGGRIWAEAAPDQGATFSFTLPTSGADAS
jgi:light-regulated signal transduction histidine kinase (bacteriophytochrome)